MAGAQIEIPSPARASEALREVEAVDAAVRWRPSRPVIVVVSLVQALTAALAVMGACWAMLAVWAFGLVLTVALRSRLIHPGVRQDPWADPLVPLRETWPAIAGGMVLPLLVLAARDVLPAARLPVAAVVLAAAAGVLCAWTLVTTARPRA